jgi:hypothetical protein
MTHHRRRLLFLTKLQRLLAIVSKRPRRRFAYQLLWIADRDALPAIMLLERFQFYNLRVANLLIYWKSTLSPLDAHRQLDWH